MKIGVLTFHNSSNNYGALLQAYALYKAIDNLGCDVEIINYVNQKTLSDRKVRFTPEQLRKLVRNCCSIGRKRGFDDFRSQLLKLSGEQISTTEGLKQLCPRYERIVCGSDQIWNYPITGNDYNYFLEYCNDSAKKASYAPSFGISEVEPEKQEKVKKLINDFRYLSIREKQGQDIIYRLTGRCAEIVLDPTFLLEQTDWQKIAKPVNKYQDYILVYSFGSASLDNFAAKLSCRTGKPIVKIDGLIRNKWNKKNVSLTDVCPREWIGLFLNAQYIVTNSFHGTAFAINFNKVFFTELLGRSSKVNSRLENILDMLDLRSRQIIDGDNPVWDNAVDYTEVNSKLRSLRKDSLQYLQSIVS